MENYSDFRKAIIKNSFSLPNINIDFEKIPVINDINSKKTLIEENNNIDENDVHHPYPIYFIKKEDIIYPNFNK